MVPHDSKRDLPLVSSERCDEAFQSMSTNDCLFKSHRAKSPSFAPNPSMYSEALNASLQSALGFAENNLPFLAHSGAAAASMVSFHHHQQQREREEKQGIER